MDKKIIELVKDLRAQTGAGVMECKKALDETDGDLKKARELITKQGLVKAAKKSDRETHQGYVATYTHTTGRIGVMVQVLTESDFVAKNDEFRQFTKNLCLQVASMAPKNVKELLGQDYIKDPGITIEDLVKSMIAKFGENIKVSKLQRFKI